MTNPTPPDYSISHIIQPLIGENGRVDLAWMVSSGVPSEHNTITADQVGYDS